VNWNPADMGRQDHHRATKLFAIGASGRIRWERSMTFALRTAPHAGQSGPPCLVIDGPCHYAPRIFPIGPFRALRARIFLLCSGYKFYGPHVGVLYSRPRRTRSIARRTV